MKILLVCSLFVACALAGNYGQQGGYSSAGLIDYPYEVLYDSKRDGPVEPPGIRRAGLVDVPYIVVYDSKRDGPQRMDNYGQQPQRMMNNYQQQPMRMNNYQQPQRMMNYQPQQQQYKPQQQQYQPMPMRSNNNQRQTSYGDYSNLIDIPYIVEYDSKRDGPNSPKKDMFRNSNLIDIPYITVYDSKRDGPNRPAGY